MLAFPSWWKFGDVSTMLVFDWRSFASFSYVEAPISGVRLTFDTYFLRLAEFGEVCYVQPPLGGV